MRVSFPPAVPTPAEWVLAQVEQRVTHHGGAYLLLRTSSDAYDVVTSSAQHFVSGFTIREAGRGVVKVQRTVGPAHNLHQFEPFTMSTRADDDHATLDILAELVAEDIQSHRDEARARAAGREA